MTTPTQVLSDEQIVALADKQFQWGKVCYVNADKYTIVPFARAIEAAVLTSIVPTVDAKDEREAFEQAFKLVFEAYSAPRDRWHSDDGYVLFMRGKITTAFGIMQKIRAALAQPSAAKDAPAVPAQSEPKP